MPVLPAVLLGILSGVLTGIINGALISYLKLFPFITTLATMTITRGIALVLTGGVSIYGFSQSFKWWEPALLAQSIHQSLYHCCLLLLLPL